MDENAATSVLIVDDLPDMRMVLKLTLQRNGWTILEAEDGNQALEIARKDHPDLIIMDYNMPMENGIETCKKIKGDPALMDIQILIYTGAYATSIHQEAIQAGADAFLTKPILPAELRSTISSFLKPKAV